MKFLEPYWEDESYDILTNKPFCIKLKRFYEWKKRHFKWWYQYLSDRYEIIYGD